MAIYNGIEHINMILEIINVTIVIKIGIRRSLIPVRTIYPVKYVETASRRQLVTIPELKRTWSRCSKRYPN